MSGAEKALAVLRDYVERSTHWREGGADRHSALEALDKADDDIEWINKGINEWRSMYLAEQQQSAAARASARIAIGHLQSVLNKCRSHAEQQAADTVARDWLISIGSEP